MKEDFGSLEGMFESLSLAWWKLLNFCRLSLTLCFVHCLLSELCPTNQCNFYCKSDQTFMGMFVNREQHAFMHVTLLKIICSRKLVVKLSKMNRFKEQLARSYWTHLFSSLWLTRTYPSPTPHPTQWATLHLPNTLEWGKKLSILLSLLVVYKLIAMCDVCSIGRAIGEIMMASTRL